MQINNAGLFQPTFLPAVSQFTHVICIDKVKRFKRGTVFGAAMKIVIDMLPLYIQVCCLAFQDTCHGRVSGKGQQ